MELLAFFALGVIMLGIFIPVAMVFLSVFVFMLVFSVALWLVSVGAIPFVLFIALLFFMWARLKQSVTPLVRRLSIGGNNYIETRLD